MDIAALTEQLRDLAKRIHTIDGGSSHRLLQLADALEQPGYGKLGTIDVYGVINPKGVEDIAFVVLQKRPWWLKFVEWVRNVLVLAPICLTWYGLWNASVNYERLISIKPELITKPFLLLWEQGFPGLGGDVGPKFSQIALADFALLLFVLTLTLVVHFYRDVLEASAAKKALALRQEIEGLLWEISRLLAEERYSQSQNSVTVQLEKYAKELVQQLSHERDRLAKLSDEQSKNLDALTTISTNFADGAQDLQRFAKDSQKTFTTLEKSIAHLAAQVKSLGEQQEQLLVTLKDIDGQMDGLVDVARYAGQSLQATADEVGGAAERALAYTGSLNGHLQEARESLDDLTRRLDVVTRNLREATGNVLSFTQSSNEVMSSLQQAGQSLAPVLQTFSQEVTKATDLLLRGVFRMEQSLGRARPSRPAAEWLIVLFGTTMLTGTSIITIAQALGLIR